MSRSAWEELDDLLAHDPGRRGVAALAPRGVLPLAARALRGAERALIVSGFPVWSGPPGSERELISESDGPPGAVALGRALERLGTEVHYLTDPRSAGLFRALGVVPQVRSWAAEEAAAEAGRLLDELDPTHVIAIELPGRAADGGYWSMRGEPIEGSGLDAVLLAGRGITIAIGDGGNEAGLAQLRTAVSAALPAGERIATVVPAHHVLVAGVSNWGAYALVAALSRLAGRDLLPSEAAVRADLSALAAAGAIDGILKTRGLEVDGQPFAATAEALAWARRAARSE